ncbi:MAG: proline dehydrogenase family protein [Chitinophagaceae bacterium]|nr:proline dehydrogenase family protein [Chitinophagaceae bacterium]
MAAYHLSFENTENAFAYKSDKELKQARFLFSTMSYKSLVKLGTLLTPALIKFGFPVKGLIRKTIFGQFVGGESLEETANVVDKLEKFGVNVILDYGVEGKEGEENFEHSCEEFIRVVKYASGQPNIPFISIKVTGFARFSLLEKLDAAANDRSGFTGNVHTEVLTEDEKAEWNRVVERMDRIIGAAASGNVAVLVDAEETWIQDPVDAVTMQMMEKYNRNRAVVYNTIQLYRSDRLQFLKDSFEESVKRNFVCGVKLVRGAYMEKERKRAAELNYPSPIQPDKASTDGDYDAALKYSIDHLGKISLIVATHNENSSLYAVRLINEKKIPHNYPDIHFSQLFGMSDNITFNLAREGYSVSKYLPFGPIKDVIPYLMRRAQENSSVAGQTGRELSLIKKEIARRRFKKRSI